MASVYALIPARVGSKGVLNKNIRRLAGRPLLAWSIKAGVLAEVVDRVIVSTDSEDYAETARKYGGETPFIRPREHASDVAGDDQVVGHMIDWLSNEEGKIPDLIAYLRPTTPLRDPSTVDAAIRKMMSGTTATSLRSIHEMSESAYKTFERQGDFLKSVGSDVTSADDANAPRQGFPTTYVGNGYVDVFRTDRIVAGQSLLGEKVYGFMTPPVAEIDTSEDFEFVEYQANKWPRIMNTLFDPS
jgi:N-acylneuraminate cytidylyltransferase